MLAKFCLRPLCFRLLDAVFAILLAVLCGWAATASAAPAKAPEGSLPTLTTTQQVHSLSSEEAKRAYPVHLRAVVTYYDPISNPVMPRCSYTIRREVFMSNSSPVRSDRFLPDRWWTCAA